MRSRGVLEKFSASGGVQKLLGDELKTEVRARLPLERAVEGIKQYAQEMTGGKILLVPGLEADGRRQEQEAG